MTTTEARPRSTRLARVGYWLLILGNIGLVAYVMPHWLSYENAEPITFALVASAASLAVALLVNFVPAIAAGAAGRRLLRWLRDSG